MSTPALLIFEPNVAFFFRWNGMPAGLGVDLGEALKDLVALPRPLDGVIHEAAERRQLPDALTHRAVSPDSLLFTVLGRLFAIWDEPNIPPQFGFARDDAPPRRYSDFAALWVTAENLERKKETVCYEYHLAIRAADGRPLEQAGNTFGLDTLTVWIKVYQGSKLLFEGSSGDYQRWLPAATEPSDAA